MADDDLKNSKITYAEAVACVSILLSNYGVRAILQMMQDVLQDRLAQNDLDETKYHDLKKQFERAQQAAFSIRRRDDAERH
jgi:hypothetical protein